MSALVNDATAQPTWARVSSVIDRHSRGDLGHAAEALSSLWANVNQDGDPIAPSKDLPPVRPFTAHLGVCT